MNTKPRMIGSMIRQTPGGFAKQNRGRPTAGFADVKKAAREASERLANRTGLPKG